MKGTKPKPASSWFPPHALLPDSVEEIEQGKHRQAELFPEPLDHSKAGRLTRLLGMVPVLRNGDKMAAEIATKRRDG